MDKKKLHQYIINDNSKELAIMIETKDIEQNIAFLKDMEFLIDRRGSKRFCKLVDMLEKDLTLEITKKFIMQIKIINEVFEECARLQGKINQIPAHLILSLMTYLSSANLNEALSQKIKNENKLKNVDNAVVFDAVSDATNKTLKSLIYNDKIFMNNVFKYGYNPLSVIISRNKYKYKVLEYIQDSFNSSQWEEKFNFWKKGMYDIRRNNNEITLKISNKERLRRSIYPHIKYRINRAQYENCSLAQYEFLECMKNIRSNDILEFLSQKILDKYFYCDSKNTLVEGVKIKHWIRSYYFLNLISGSCFNDSPEVQKLNVFNCVIVKTRKQWINFFVNNGIPYESAEIIFDHLIFGRKSTDLNDYPFIPTQNKYMIVKTICRWIHPAWSVISRFNSKDVNIDIKGKNFEKNFHRFLDLVKIPYVQIHHKEKNEEYECDAVFYLNDTFVFCECKCRTGHESESVESLKYEEDINQLKRISNFYKQNMKLVFDAFEVKGVKIHSKKFYYTKNIVIHSAPVDGVLIKDDTYVMDFDTFIMPFDRKYIFNEYVKKKSLKKVFEGEITIYKLFKFYDSDFCVYNYRDKIEFKDRQMTLGKFNFKIEDFHAVDFFSSELIKNETRIQIENVFRQKGFNENIINMLIK